jgi:hypothetical protein
VSDWEVRRSFSELDVKLRMFRDFKVYLDLLTGEIGFFDGGEIILLLLLLLLI